MFVQKLKYSSSSGQAKPANFLGRHSLRLEKNGYGEVMYFPLEFETLLALEAFYVEVGRQTKHSYKSKRLKCRNSR